MQNTGRWLKWKPSLILVLLVGCLLWPLVFANPAAAQRSFTIEQDIIDAEVLPDASLRATERLTIDFSGQWNGFFMEIEQDNTPIQEIVVSENGRAYTFNPGTDYGPPGTFLVKRQGDKVLIDWSIMAQDEKRTFDVSYRVVNAVQVHRDVAELYRKFISETNEFEVGEVRVNLKLPPGAASYKQGEEIKIWGHGPLHGEVNFAAANMVVWQIQDLPARTFMEGRVVMPVALFPQAPAAAHTGKEALAGILAEEEGWAQEANQQRWLARADNGGALAVILGVIGTIGLLWYKFGRRHPAQFEGEYFRELPADYSPAELSLLWNFDKLKAQDLTATILDLARRKFLQIHEETIEVKKFLGTREITTYRLTFLPRPEPAALKKPEQAVLRKHEQELLDYLGQTIAEGRDSLTLHDIEVYGKESGKEFYNFWQQWTAGIKQQAEPLKFFDPKGKMPIVTFLVGVVLFIGGALVLVSMTALGVALMGGGLTLSIIPVLFRRRSASGQEQMVRWQAFRRFLTDFSEMERHEIPSLVIWEHYLVYAVTLGVAQEVIKQLALVFPNMQDGDYHFGHGWFIYGAHGDMSALPDSFNGIGDALERSVNSARAAVSKPSSGGGFGGGFSGGGGFGGGGGSFGGR